MADYQGTIKGKVVEVRFAISGKVTKVNKTTGDTVNKMDLLASLDRKFSQAELDKQLSHFEKTRTEFEIFNQKQVEPVDTIEKYLKAGKQAELNASVKEVEIAKSKLDQCDLISPVEGILIDDGNITEGTYITPSSSPLAVIDINSLYFEFEIAQAELANFSEPKNADIEIEGITDKLHGQTLAVFSDGKKLFVKIKLDKNPKLLLGLVGKVSL